MARRWEPARGRAHQALGSVRVWRERCDIRGMVPWVRVSVGHRRPPLRTARGVQLCRDGDAWMLVGLHEQSRGTARQEKQVKGGLRQALLLGVHVHVGNMGKQVSVLLQQMKKLLVTDVIATSLCQSSSARPRH